MATLDSKQMVMGKSFEYALITQFEEKLKKLTKLEVIKNSSANFEFYGNGFLL